ncbi:Histone-lysine N-methyltransferase atxr6 [Ranunculus cassubicifolius]
MASPSSTSLKRKRTQAPKPLLSHPPPLIILDDSEDESYDDVHCEECNGGDAAEKLLLCDKCDRGFHIFCLKPILASVPKGSWFCFSCSNPKQLKRFPLVQTKIIDFFRIQKPLESPQKIIKDGRKKRKGLVMSKKKRRLLSFSPSEDPKRRLEQMASLATAMKATGMEEFNNELSYVKGMAPKSANCAALEKDGMQVLSKDDTETLNLCKNMIKQGEWPPLMVVFDSKEGFTVEADKVIKDWTIITEYTGDVDYLDNRENDDGDSIMTLLHAKNRSQSLVICPDKRGNIARFINGINNHTPNRSNFRRFVIIRLFDYGGLWIGIWDLMVFV